MAICELRKSNGKRVCHGKCPKGGRSKDMTCYSPYGYEMREGGFWGKLFRGPYALTYEGDQLLVAFHSATTDTMENIVFLLNTAFQEGIRSATRPEIPWDENHQGQKLLIDRSELNPVKTGSNGGVYEN